MRLLGTRPRISEFGGTYGRITRKGQRSTNGGKNERIEGEKRKERKIKEKN